MQAIETILNPELQVRGGNMSFWTRADQRRYGFHNLHRIARYSASFRAARVMPLEKRADLRIAELDSVRHLTSLPSFSAMVIVRGQHILFERYAPDFGSEAAHSIQSITKSMMNLAVGSLVARKLLDLSRPVAHYIPEIGSGYAGATVQQVLNMDVVNDYSEDFSDPNATYYLHEEAMGWRLPRDLADEQTQRRFLPRIQSPDTVNRDGHIHYKDANSDVLGWVVERAGGRPLRAFLADVADAAGIEGALHITMDRDGVPALDGGACLTARDLARFMSIFARRGMGVNGEAVGSAAFIDATLGSGVSMVPPWDWLRYSNQTIVFDHYIGHGGWGGQFALANLHTGAVGVFLSVIESEHAITRDYLPPVIRMLAAATGDGKPYPSI